jgi:hypothetical protein
VPSSALTGTAAPSPEKASSSCARPTQCSGRTAVKPRLRPRCPGPWRQDRAARGSPPASGAATSTGSCWRRCFGQRRNRPGLHPSSSRPDRPGLRLYASKTQGMGLLTIDTWCSRLSSGAHAAPKRVPPAAPARSRRQLPLKPSTAHPASPRNTLTTRRCPARQPSEDAFPLGSSVTEPVPPSRSGDTPTTQPGLAHLSGASAIESLTALSRRHRWISRRFSAKAKLRSRRPR